VRRPLGRRKCKGEENIKTDLREVVGKCGLDSCDPG
jgi:hypothetical protein